MRLLARLSTETERAGTGSGLASVNSTTRYDSSFPGERFFVCIYIYICVCVCVFSYTPERARLPPWALPRRPQGVPHRGNLVRARVAWRPARWPPLSLRIMCHHVPI